MSIVQIDPIGVEFRLPEALLAGLLAAREAKTVRIGLALPGGKRLEGSLVFVNNTVNTDSATITLKASFPNAAKTLWPGAYVEVRIDTGLYPYTLQSVGPNALDLWAARLVCALTGALPIALGIGAGAELRQPLGVAIVGGMPVWQLITLFITPVLYVWFDLLGAVHLEPARATPPVPRPVAESVPLQESTNAAG